ncbi:MAG: hypothetical protein IKI31_03685, partial [Treponema sp.]|nr:hypothetical protein [Treponema sp.]
MNKMDIDFVQSGINYQFKNKKLLLQAFTRKSYSEENPEFQNNEILEFYGDEILDFFVTKQMHKQFSKIINGMLVSEKNEDELTKLKSILVSKQSLANCMYNFEFSKFLLLGKSDEKNAVQNSISVNEDLFEAIIGAVAVDCNWDYSILEKVCKTMLQMETVNTYLAILVAEKSVRLGFGPPIYCPVNFQITKGEDMRPHNFTNSYLGLRMGCTSKNPNTGIYEYDMEIGGHKFNGKGDGAFQAKLDAEKQAYHFLCKEEIKKHFADIDYENAVSTLHELFQKNVIME